MLPSTSSRSTFLISTLKLTRIENYHVGVWLELILERNSSFGPRPQDPDGEIERPMAYVELELGGGLRPHKPTSSFSRTEPKAWWCSLAHPRPRTESQTEPSSPVSASRSVRFSFHEPGHRKRPCHE